MLFAAEENNILADMTKCVGRERKRGTWMDLPSVKSSLEQDYKADRRRRKKKKRKGQAKRGSSNSESSSGEEIEDDRLEEQALVARCQMQPFQRPLRPSWKPEYQQNQFCQSPWNNSIGSPMEECQRQLQQ